MFLFITTSVKFHLKFTSTKFLLPMISLKWTLYNYIFYGRRRYGLFPQLFPNVTSFVLNLLTYFSFTGNIKCACEISINYQVVCLLLVYSVIFRNRINIARDACKLIIANWVLINIVRDACKLIIANWVLINIVRDACKLIIANWVLISTTFLLN